MTSKTCIFTISTGRTGTACKYPTNILRVRRDLDIYEKLVWYVLEVRARSEYYRLCLVGKKNVEYYRLNMEDIVTEAGSKNLLKKIAGPVAPVKIIVPAPQNENMSSTILPSDQEERLTKAAKSMISTDIEGIARQAFERGSHF